MLNIFKNTKQRLFNKRVFGFDIETANNNKDFVMASLVNKDESYEKLFYSASAVVEEIKTNPIFRNSVVFATNLSFDFFGTFFNKDESKNFYTLFRGSDLLLAKSHYYKGDFYPKAKIKTKALKSILFLDSLNFAKLSVSKMGNILGMPKLEHPDCLGNHPQNENEWKGMIEYNLRDSYITYHFMKFLISSFETLGATFKNTLASTSMSLFKNKYLDADYIQPDEALLLEQFESYYGGRTEAFKRGHFKNYNYYDFNSLYPSVMRDKEYPDPNSLRITFKNTKDYIRKYHGCSNVDVFVPSSMQYPILPHRTESGKVIFATGNISGWYTHIELREAMNQGCYISKVYKTHYFTKTCNPFKGFVNDLYNLRLQFKKANNAMEYVVKITMNSLYGKFGQKFLNRDNWVHESQIDINDLASADTFERKGDFIRINKSWSRPSSFCIPIWASYVAAYGRLKLHAAILLTDPIYCDTDSLITNRILPESSELGELKLEMKVKEGIVVRPKFYALMSDDDEEYVKIKGLGKRLSYLEFVGLMHSPLNEFGKTKQIKYDKFTKFKEALRRDFIPNEIIQVHKEFSLEDEKRVWPGLFEEGKLQTSSPLTI